MSKLYYIEYKIEQTDGQAYLLDTGFGVLELGQIENNQIWNSTELLGYKDIADFLNSEGYIGITSCTRVL